MIIIQSLVSVCFWMKSLSFTKAAFFYYSFIYFWSNTVITVVTQLSNIIRIWKNWFLFEYIEKKIFLWCAAVFSASLLQSSVSHDPSEIILIYWFTAQETVLIIINVENSCAASYFCRNCDKKKIQNILISIFINYLFT